MDGFAERPNADHYLTRDSVVYALDRDAEPRQACTSKIDVSVRWKCLAFDHRQGGSRLALGA